ncbi:MAG: hypothetical protein SGI92_14485 [Bryobacteraceae bacterium]|nr:hypothetical protein [Bryobacteraceae bacterium]
MNGFPEVSDLEVIGYGNVLTSTMLPSVEPPVYRFRDDPDQILVPPFSLHGNLVIGATIISGQEAETLACRGDMTLFESSFAAQPGFLLWIDLSGNARYELRRVAEAELGRIADDALAKAEHELLRDLDAAEHWSGVALSADDRRIEPVALKAAVLIRRGDHTSAEYLATLLPPSATRRTFEKLVQEYLSMSRPHIMSNVASIRPVAAAA